MKIEMPRQGSYHRPRLKRMCFSVCSSASGLYRGLVAIFVGGTFRLCGGAFSWRPGTGVAADLAATSEEVAVSGVDRPTVDIRLGGRSLGRAPLSDWRFEGFVNPKAYFDARGSLRTMRSPWAESPEDVRQALEWARQNETRLRAVVGWKLRRFRLGRAWEAAPREPGYFRGVALDASSWLAQLRSAGVPLTGSFVNFGAADGVGDDPLHAVARAFRPAFVMTGADVSLSAADAASDRARMSPPQLAVEADTELCAKHRQNLPWVQLACTRVTPQNAKKLVAAVFPSVEVREALDILKLDIDSFEAFVLEEALLRAGLKPKLILVEVNAGIPPPFQYALHYSPQFRAAFETIALSIGEGRGDPLEINMPVAGVSLSYLVRRLAPEYSLLALGSPDAIFARRDVLERLGREPLDEFKAFEWGWVDVHGFSRRQIRRWYYELDEVDALGEIHDYLTDWMQRHLGVVLPFVLSY